MGPQMDTVSVWVASELIAMGCLYDNHLKEAGKNDELKVPLGAEQRS